MIVQVSLNKRGFDLVSWTASGHGSSESIDLVESINVQGACLRIALEGLISEVKEKDRQHREKYKGTSLEAILKAEGLDYAFEKLAEGTSRPLPLGGASAERVRSVMNELNLALAERGLAIDTYVGLEHDWKSAEYALQQLELYYGARGSDVANDQAAVVFTDYLKSQFDRLRDIAAEIDAEYQAPDQGRDDGEVQRR